ncbi:Methylated-DNA--protein-cysteine methyltransferase, constitutive [Kingella potus]|uniref:Methylated-DNA--protein-cysteine methyltransferase n=1 Tax=Kingella potus TaxID=265175 RepID=A0A377R075_9NEIS|nr:methylated-DNA--[protein]-cysteine S-methyltransferase [Kingella potus]UOP00767.1 methylated-DNA--[protein]-cysteine S-methyltransferase [Kingella potus]STR00405.1 Methylated-DNA--protein-cysteine methyltransferase, constitutive [Kingella potus]
MDRNIARPSETNLLNRIRIETPLGWMSAVFSPKGLCLLEFEGQKHLDSELKAVAFYYHADGFTAKETGETQNLRRQLDGYFSGKRQNFDLPLDLVGTPFQKKVWHILQTIPYGETRSYKQQSEMSGNPKAVRAVAAANGANKISIIVPCHRVIGSDGSLTGYAGGLPRKQALLALESGNASLF